MSDPTWMRDAREVAEAKVARGERMMSVNPAMLIELIDEVERLRKPRPVVEKVARAPYDGAPYDGCHGARDGECIWDACPQLRDGEPEASGRHCPLDTETDR